MDIAPLLEQSSRQHSHLCPRQVLGVRIGLAGRRALGFVELPSKRQLLILAETDGCFVDGLSAATGCTVGHRSLRIMDYGKVAATFVDVRFERAVRVAPVPEARRLAGSLLSAETRAYFAQLHAYQHLPDSELLSFQEVILNTRASEILSRPGARANCHCCGEEILNDRQVVRDGFALCRTCAGDTYFRLGCSVPPVEGLVPRE